MNAFALCAPFFLLARGGSNGRPFVRWSHSAAEHNRIFDLSLTAHSLLGRSIDALTQTITNYVGAKGGKDWKFLKENVDAKNNAGDFSQRVLHVCLDKV